MEKSQYRVDRPDYADRTIPEVFANPLINRTYILLGSGTHKRKVDDHPELQSRMYDDQSIPNRDIRMVGSTQQGF